MKTKLAIAVIKPVTLWLLDHRQQRGERQRIYQLLDTNSHLYSNDFTGGSRLNHKHTDPL